MTARYDLTVVGGSFAGLACAQAAAASGVDVALLEARQAPGSRLRTTGILVQEAACQIELPSKLVSRIEGVRLYAPNLCSIDLASPGYAFYATDLPRLMDYMTMNARRAGVDVRLGTPFRSASRCGDRWVLDEHGLSTRFLVGADGARSAVARHFALGQNRRFLVGVEHEYEGVGGVDDRFLHVFIDAELAPGYIAWVVPGPRVVQVGLAVSYRGKLRHELLVEKLKRVFDFSRARLVEKRGGPIPVGGRVDPIVRGSVVLLGDAAGTVSPLTAGGIHRALELGPLVGQRIAEAALGGEPPAAFEARMRRELASQYPRYRAKRLLRLLADRSPANRVVDRMFGNALFTSLAQLVFFHQRGLMSRAAWTDLRRLLAG